ncbi:type I pullulanase [Bacillus carboniphilus]|uniref:Type I pullulanase n=1 Tax=Bacillus carboniphilus TaxID=86663 RepID=A0ABY9JU01_9BACI|nr:type I pullulanase [Bacillus carboniphilus]WLR41150.1 type I pullulanase [Bacillus carboniphilus]
MLRVNRFFQAFLDDYETITILIPRQGYDGLEKTFVLLDQDASIPLNIEESYEVENHIKFVCKFKTIIEIGSLYEIVDERGRKTDLQIGAIIRTKQFDKDFYTDQPLGISYSSEKIKGSLWAPTALYVKVRLWKSNEHNMMEMALTRGNKGVWTFEKKGNYEGYFYMFLVCVNLVWYELVDPYAKAVSINGEWGVVVDLSKTSIRRFSTPFMKHKTDAVIYELHVRDASMHQRSGIIEKGTFNGLTEIPTKTPEDLSTGLSYFKELGISHIELLPVNDFGGVDERMPFSQYNWGYNPVHYQAVEGSYSSDPFDPYARIEELKEVIQAFHKQGIKVIIDVVYNHVYIKEQSHFEKLVPGYFFRYDQYGFPSNGTGVGNDFASERKMARRYILDSIKYWLEEYDVDGFRFDLMGILDIETMKQVSKLTQDRKKDIFLLGEGWDLPTILPYGDKAIISNSAQLPFISFFNDQFRDSIKGSTFHLHEKGYALGNSHKRTEVRESVTGSIHFSSVLKGIFEEPVQSINYVESHDNHTFWDKMSVCCSDEQEEILRKRQRLATSMVILSQGIPFLHAGQEFYRTKKGIGNSYNSMDDINQLDWSKRECFHDDVDYVKELIKLRRSHGAFRFHTNRKIKDHFLVIEDLNPVISYHLKDVKKYGPWSDIVVVHNHLYLKKQLILPKEGTWYLACTPERCSAFEVNDIIEKQLEIEDIGTYILYCV